VRSVEYPNRVEDLVVLNFKSSRRIGFTVRPAVSGRFSLIVWPDGLVDPNLFGHVELEIASESGPPAHAVMDLGSSNFRTFRTWRWSLIKAPEESSPLEDLARAVSGIDVIASARFETHSGAGTDEARVVAWSCHQPYTSDAAGTAELGVDASRVLSWYESVVREFAPHVVWGAGDSAYSDGTPATDFSSQVYGQGSWHHNPVNRAWLRSQYRSMYRHFWSLEQLRRVLSSCPHLFIWDDHEIHDGWGSEGQDFEPGNLEMFRLAKEVADEYILRAGPRLRLGGPDAHQAYLMGPLASFIFDTRTTRNYEAKRDRLISRQQFDDFAAFLRSIRRDANVTDLVTSTSVPFVGLRTWVTSLATRAPDLLNDALLTGVRDDVRDSWTSPGNIEALAAVLSALRAFMADRPDVRVTNVSGDVHVAHGFEIHVPRVSRPIRQLTTSALTNRVHPPDILLELIEISDQAFVDGVGDVQRIWKTVTDPNVLLMRIGRSEAEFTLKVWDRDSPGAQDVSLIA